MKKYLRMIPFVLLMVMVLMGVFNYLMNPEAVMQAYVDLGFPTWVYYFTLVAKVVGVLALVIPQVPMRVKDYAWAGLLYIFLMALIAHLVVDDGEYMGAAIALVLWVLATAVGCCCSCACCSKSCGTDKQCDTGSCESSVGQQ